VAVIKDFIAAGININDPFGFAQSVILNKKLQVKLSFRIIER
jgi:hypothetical protein